MPLAFKDHSFTPVRQLFTGVFQPSAARLAKRRHQSMGGCINTSTLQSTNDSQTSSRPQKPLPKTHSRFALQTHDGDAVVITTLENIPFCCPNDLCFMPRQELASVAMTLNGKLPNALLIDIGSSKSDHEIRNEIESILGISRSVPKAPEHPIRRSQSLDCRPSRYFHPPESPPSPLAGRSKRLSCGTPYSSRSPGLESLTEADEETEPDNILPSKKRCTSSRDMLRADLLRHLQQDYDNAQKKSVSTLMESPTPPPLNLSSKYGKSMLMSRARSPIFTNLPHRFRKNAESQTIG